MRVSFVGAVPPLGGGIAQHGGNVVQALRAEGHEVDVHSWGSQYPRRLFKGDSQIRPGVPPLPGARFDLWWWDPLSWIRCGRTARTSDLLVFPWITPAQGPALAVISQTAGPDTEIVAIVHNSRPHESFPLLRPLTQLGLSRVNRLVAHAPQVLDELRHLGIDRPGVTTPHPPNVQVAQHQLPPSKPLRLVFLGFLRAYKGPDIAVEVLGELHAAGVDARLTIAGEPWDDPAPLRERAVELGIGDRLDLDLRYLSDEELAAAVAAHHIVLLPYRSATQSGIIPLAHAGGRPVVATDVGGLSEQVDDQSDGRLVPLGDVTGLADAVREVAADLEGYSRSAAAAAPTWSDVANAVTQHPRPR